MFSSLLFRKRSVKKQNSQKRQRNRNLKGRPDEYRTVKYDFYSTSSFSAEQ